MLLCSSIWLWFHHGENQVEFLTKLHHYFLGVVLDNIIFQLILEFCIGMNPGGVGQNVKQTQPHDTAENSYQGHWDGTSKLIYCD